MSTHVLEHLVYFTPPGGLERISTEFRNLGFDVLPGGTHADGLTANTLITLADGVYIELLAFVSPDTSPPPSHRYAAAPPGWTDFAFVGCVPGVDHVVNARAAHDGSGVAYRPTALRGRRAPGPGGQMRQLQWRSTQPEAAHGVGRVPFFCGDVTPREWRVPAPGTHASTARGVAYVKLRAVGADEFAMMTAQLMTVLGIPPSATTETSTTWPLDTPIGLAGLQTELILERAGDGASPADIKSGIYEVGCWVDKGPGGRVEAEHGSVVWTPVP